MLGGLVSTSLQPCCAPTLLLRSLESFGASWEQDWHPQHHPTHVVLSPCQHLQEQWQEDTESDITIWKFGTNLNSGAATSVPGRARVKPQQSKMPPVPTLAPSCTQGCAHTHVLPWFAPWPMIGAGPLLALAYFLEKQLPFCIPWDAVREMTLREPLSHLQSAVAVRCPVSNPFTSIFQHKK